MKRTALTIIILAILVASFLVFTACDEPEHTCNFDEWTVTKQPTCTEVGERERYCSCGEKQTSSLAATGHSYTHVVTDPTCTEQGFTTHTCAGCGNSYVDTYVKATDHSYTAAVTSPTCTEKGFTTHTCDCGDSYVDTYVDALGHTEGSVVVENNVDATCTTDGSYDNVVYCTVCDAELSRETKTVDALGHDELEHIAQAPTCTAVGWDAYATCSRCNYSTYNEIPAGHSHSSVVTPPTCTEKGFTTHTCHCGDSYVDTYVDALGHTEGLVVVENKVDAICTTNGSYDNVVYCSVCEVELSRETKTVDALGHDEIEHIAQAPTCTEIGWNAYVTCSRCNYSTYNEIPATDHEYIPIVTPPTCTEKGFTTHTCDCGDSYIDAYVDATGHTEGLVVVENNVDATCTTDGSYDNVVCCTVCEVELSRETKTVDALRHDEIEHIAQAPTCTAVGWDAYVTCSRCDYSTYVEIPAGHSHSSVVTPPTCTEKGFTTHICPCGDSFIDTYVNSSGIHNFQESNTCKYCEIDIADVAIDSYNMSATPDDNLRGYVVPLINGTYDVYIKGIGVMKDYTSNTAPFKVDGYNSKIVNVYMEDSVTTIGNYAFYDCIRLTSVAFGENSRLTTIGRRAFYGCDSLTSIVIPDSVTTIGDNAFYGCLALVEVYNYSSLNIKEGSGDYGYVAYYAFDVYTTNEPSKLTTDENGFVIHTNGDVKTLVRYIGTGTEIAIPDSVTTIDNSAFRDCYNLTSIVIPDSVTTIGNYTFYYCNSLTSIVIPDSVPTIGNYTFYYCNSLTSIVIPDSVTTIGENAFACCDSLTNVTIGKGVTTIGNYAFSGCTSLISITIPDSVTTIGEGAFGSCYSLTSITIPSSVTTIDDLAFRGCSGLTSVTFEENSRLTTIGTEAFVNCSGLTSITIPDSVTTIGEGAFGSCYSLTSVTIGNSVKSIGDYTFAYCDSLTSITIPDSVTIIGKYAFYYCLELTRIAIQNNVAIIDDYAFKDCNNLTSVIIGENVTIIGNQAFRGCYNLTDVYYKGTAEQWNRVEVYSSLNNATIHFATCYEHIYTSDCDSTCNNCGETRYGWEHAYESDCDSICNNCGETRETVSDHIDEDADGICDYCGEYTSLSNFTFELNSDGEGYTIRYAHYSIEGDITIPSTYQGKPVTAIGEGAFRDCASLTSITIPNSVTIIGKEAFLYCYNLTRISIPDSVTIIDDDAFRYCGSLTSVIIGKNVTIIGNRAFEDCGALTDVYYKGTAEQWNRVEVYSSLNNATIHYNNVAEEN